MASNGEKKVKNFLSTKKNSQPHWASTYYHSFLFCCDRFRNVFRLPDFGFEEFDAALILESGNYRAGDKLVHRTPLLEKLLVALLKPYQKNATQKSKDETLHGLLERRMVSYDRPNPLGEFGEKADFHRLPTEVKLFLFNFLMELRVNRDEAETVDEYCDPTALRVLDVGEDTTGNHYWYFGEFRLVIESKQQSENYPKIETASISAAPWRMQYEEFCDSCTMLVVADSKETWKELWEMLAAGTSRVNKAISYTIKGLYEGELEAHSLELARRAKAKNDELRQLQQMELATQRELGMVRISDRLQAKKIAHDEARKMAREEEERLDRELGIRSFSSNGDYSGENRRPKTREERRLQREAVIEEQMVQSRNGAELYGDMPSLHNYQEEDTDGTDSMDYDSSSTFSQAPRQNGDQQLPGQIIHRNGEPRETDFTDFRKREANQRREYESEEPKTKLRRIENEPDDRTPDVLQFVRKSQPYMEACACSEFPGCSFDEYHHAVEKEFVDDSNSEYYFLLQVAGIFFHQECNELVRKNLAIRDIAYYKERLCKYFEQFRSDNEVRSKTGLVKIVDRIGTEWCSTIVHRQLLLQIIGIMQKAWKELFVDGTQEDTVCLEMLQRLRFRLKAQDEERPTFQR